MKNLVLDKVLCDCPSLKEVVFAHPEYQKFRQNYEIEMLPPKLRRIVDFLKEQQGGYTGTDIAKSLRLERGNLVSVQLKHILSRTTCVLNLEKHGERGGLYSFNHLSSN